MLTPVMTARVREILSDHARLPVDVSAIADNADLYDSGMTSHASVNVMLALEEGFDVEFPDSMLTRSVFASINSICAAIAQLEQAQAA
ncbi:MAG TPA: acyl carrier protein [Sphingomicrobium sp.]|nr:acyl carrier protein [Sphingomicrobium sp.]